MTWVGWFIVFELFFSAAIMFYRAGQGGYFRSASSAAFAGVEMLVLVVLILLVGTGSL